MESNNFEKEVGRRMNEFKLAPEEDVWARIEKEIASKKGTRKIILLFFLLAFISAGGFWWTYYQSISKSPSTFENLVKKKNSNKRNGIILDNSVKNFQTKNSGLSKSSKRSAHISSVQPVSINSTKTISGKSDPVTSAKSVKTITSKSIKSISETSYEAVESLNEWQREVSNNICVPCKIINKPFVPDLTISKRFQSQTLNAPPKVSPALTKQTNKKHAWRSGITFSAGASWIESMEPGALPAYYVQTSGFNTGSYYYMPGYVYYASRPSSFQSSFCFTAGVFAERNLSPKTNISVGLSYLQSSLQNNVRNNFEFAEVPVLFHFHVNRNVRFPLTLDAGLTAAQMVGSNARQYNYLYGRWYHDNDLFNKFQTNVGAGFSLAVSKRHEREIRFGPRFYYGLIPLANHGIYDGKHLHGLNIHAQMLFGKK